MKNYLTKYLENPPETDQQNQQKVLAILEKCTKGEPVKPEKVPFAGFNGSFPEDLSKIEENIEMHDSAWVTRCYYCGSPLTQSNVCAICAQTLPF
jgi:hypothetical protein